MGGDWMDVCPSSTSFDPFDAPAARPVMKQLLDPWQMPA
jgi:hypothetical protein